MTEGPLAFDDRASRRVEAIYATADVVAQRHAVAGALKPAPGEHIVDVGSGPGMLACELAEAVGPEGRITGVEPSDQMRSLALARAGRLALGERVRFEAGDATSLPLPEASADAAVSTQVLEYVPEVEAALLEMHRIVRPGGRALVLDTDWDAIVWRSSDAARMRRVLRAWDEHLAHPHLPRALPAMLHAAGFRLGQAAVVPILNLEYSDQTYSHGLVQLITEFVPGRQGVTAEVCDAWRRDFEDLAQRGEYFFSLNRYMFVATRS